MRTRSVPLATLLAGALALACADAPTRPTALPFNTALVVVPTDSAARGTTARAAAAASRAPEVGAAAAARLEVVSVTDLGALGYWGSYASGINNAGQVVGATAVGADPGFYYEEHAFVWDRATGMRDLGTFGADYSRATAINDAGRVVGFVATMVSPEDGCYEGAVSFPRAFAWDAASGLRELAPLGGEFETSVATDVNAAGDVVGYSETFGGCYGYGWEAARATVWAPGAAPLDLGLLPDTWSEVSRAEGINGAGHVVGSSFSEAPDFPGAGDVASHAFRWRPADGMTPLAPTPGPPGWSGAAAMDVNDAGQAVGASGGFTSVELDSRPSLVVGGSATLWEPGGAAVDLGRLPGDAWSVATAINNAGHVVGSSTLPDGLVETRPFLWQRGVGLRALPLLAGHAQGAATDINDAGQAVGWSQVSSYGRRRAVLWTLRAEGAPVVDRLQAGALAPGVYPAYAPDGGVWLRVRLTDADTPSPGPWAWRIDWGDGVVHAPTIALKGEFVLLRSTPYAAGGPHVITVTATDPGGAQSAPAATTAPSVGR